MVLLQIQRAEGPFGRDQRGSPRVRRCLGVASPLRVNRWPWTSPIHFASCMTEGWRHRAGRGRGLAELIPTPTRSSPWVITRPQLCTSGRVGDLIERRLGPRRSRLCTHPYDARIRATRPYRPATLGRA